MILSFFSSIRRHIGNLLPGLLAMSVLSIGGSLKAAPQAATAVSIEAGDIPIEHSSKWEATVRLPELPEGHRAVLTFQAWYQAPSVSGYYRHMRLLWGKTPLTTLIDRPTSFRIVSGSELDTVTMHGYLVPLLSDPETMLNDALYRSRYRPEQEGIDPSVFRFELSEADFPGEHELVIQNRITAGRGVKFPTLMVRNLRIVFEPNTSGFQDR